MKKNLLIVITLWLVLTGQAVVAGQQQAAAAVEAVLFDLDTIGVEYINYRVDASGNVSMTIDDTVPDDLYETLLDRLRAHADINSVLASKGPACPIPYRRNRQ